MRRRASAEDRERGWMTLWVLGLCVMVMFLGGVSLDLWRAFSQRRDLAAAADSAARAGTSGIDVAAFRRGEGLHLDPDRARQLALENLEHQSVAPKLSAWDVTVDVAAQTVHVRLEREMDFTLVKTLMGGGSIPVSATADARPHSRD